MIDRDQFKQKFQNMYIDVADDSPLWIPEHDLEPEDKCKWFAFIDKVDIESILEYHDWNEKTLQGKALCFSAGESGIWMGFQYPEDVTLFILRWT